MTGSHVMSKRGGWQADEELAGMAGPTKWILGGLGIATLAGVGLLRRYRVKVSVELQPREEWRLRSGEWKFGISRISGPQSVRIVDLVFVAIWIQWQSAPHHPSEQALVDQFKREIARKGWPLTHASLLGVAPERRVLLGRQRDLLPSGKVLHAAAIDPNHPGYRRTDRRRLVPRGDLLWFDALYDLIEPGLNVVACAGEIDGSGEPSIWLETPPEPTPEQLAGRIS